MSEITEKVVSTLDKDVPRGDAIVAQAKARFRDSDSYEEENRKEAIDDLNMLAGKDHWPAKIKKERELEGRPCLTINKLPSFVDQVVNDSRMNKIGVKVTPYGGGATKDMAERLQGIIKGIESASRADQARQTALAGAANCGFGFYRVVTEYADDSSFDQTIRIKRIRNNMSVHCDPSSVELDGRDSRYYIVSEWVSRAEYEVRFGKSITPFAECSGDFISDWFEEDRVRIAEYWVKEPVTKRLYLLSDGRTVDGDDWDSIADDLKANEQVVHYPPPPPQPPQEPPPQDMEDPTVQAEPPQPPPLPQPVEGPAPEGSGYPEEIINPTPTVVRERKVASHKVMQYLIDGEGILEETEWAGKHIPIIPVWGKETIIGEKRLLRGVIRFAKDPQKMYDYFRTAATETVALAPKAPWLLTGEQIEGYEDEWEESTRKNRAFLRYRNIPGVNPPQRQIVTQTAIGEITESNISNDEMKSTTSLFDASLGSQGNETSGRAIIARQREGDVANFTYHDNLDIAVQFEGEILIDLIPRIIDTERQIAIINGMEEEEIITVNQEVVDVATGNKVIINDLSLGTYKVTTTTGPSFSTQREEAAQSMLDFIRVAPDLAGYFIDLIAENMQWPGSAKIANRLRKLLPPGIDEEGPPEPQPPSIDDIFKELKAKGTLLGNEKKKLDIIQQKRELEGGHQAVAEAGARGAMMALGLIRKEENGKAN